MKVAFLGLGIMGSRMARHVAAAGHELTVWNRSPGPRAAFSRAADSATDAVAGAELVISMLANPDVVREVVIDGGVLAALPAGAIWADASTVDPAFARTSAEAAVAAGVRYLGIPVAGTREPAESGQLKTLVGGEAAALEDARAVIETYSGAGIVHVHGRPDAGASLKILVNGMLAQSMLVFSETLLLGEAMGMPRDFLLKVLPNLPVIAPFVGAKRAMIEADDYTDASFPLELMHKDVHLMVKTAYEVNQPLFLAGLTKEVFAQAKQDGRGREDFAGVHGFLSNLGG